MNKIIPAAYQAQEARSLRSSNASRAGAGRPIFGIDGDDNCLTFTVFGEGSGVSGQGRLEGLSEGLDGRRGGVGEALIFAFSGLGGGGGVPAMWEKGGKLDCAAALRKWTIMEGEEIANNVLDLNPGHYRVLLQARRSFPGVLASSRRWWWKK
jgi:hypothetical protein